MPSYVILMTATDQGMKAMNRLAESANAVKAALERRGMTYHGIYLTQGLYDVVMIVDSPTEELLMSALIDNAMRGNVRTMTMRGFTPDEVQRIVAAGPLLADVPQPTA